MNRAIRAGLYILLMVFTSIPNTTFTFALPVTNLRNPHIKPEPEYAKWGKLAVSETQKRYPQATVVDYLHIGRQVVSRSTTQEMFKLWLKDEEHEFGVYVQILFDSKTEQILNISFQETQR